MKTKNQMSLQLLIVLIIVTGAYALLKNSGHPAKIDLIIEGALFLFAGLVGIRGIIQKTGKETRLFRRFEGFYAFTYIIVAMACMLGIIFLFQNPGVHEIGIDIVRQSPLLQGMSVVKSVSFIFMFLAWYFFYRNLNIQAGKKKKILAFSIGFGGYFGASLIILAFTGDQSIISLGLIVGAAIGLFAMISLHPKTRYLSVIFLIFSVIHLWEFYLMGMGKALVTGINNPVYWLVVILYALEVNRWIQREQYELSPQLEAT